MRIVNMHAAKTNLSKLVEAVAAGEEVVIARSGKPVARLVGVGAADPAPTVVSAAPASTGRRVLGLGAHLNWKVPDDFDTMCAEEIRAMFEDGPIFSEDR